MNESVINPQPGLLNAFTGRGGPDAGGIPQFCTGFGPDLTGTVTYYLVRSVSIIQVIILNVIRLSSS